MKIEVTIWNENEKLTSIQPCAVFFDTWLNSYYCRNVWKILLFFVNKKGFLTFLQYVRLPQSNNYIN